jgi:hypothetical protein
MAVTFELGRMVATPGALSLFASGVNPTDLLARHYSGDWGDLGAFDRRENDRALKTGERLFSAYDTPAGRVWIITEADRSSTCVLLPEEY